MIAGDGFFVVPLGRRDPVHPQRRVLVRRQRQAGLRRRRARAGLDGQNGVIVPGQGIGDIRLPVGALSPATATTTARVTGNLPSGAAVGEQLVRDIKTYDAEGTATSLRFTFTRTAAAGATPSLAARTPLSRSPTASRRRLLHSLRGVTVDLSAVTGFADVSDVAIKEQNGKPAGTLSSYALMNDGSLGRHLQQRRHRGAPPASPWQGSSTRRTREGRLLSVPPERQLRRADARAGGHRRPGRHHQRRARDVQRRPVAGVHQPDRRAARLPGRTPASSPPATRCCRSSRT